MCEGEEAGLLEEAVDVGAPGEQQGSDLDPTCLKLEEEELVLSGGGKGGSEAKALLHRGEEPAEVGGEDQVEGNRGALDSQLEEGGRLGGGVGGQVGLEDNQLADGHVGGQGGGEEAARLWISLLAGRIS